MWLFNTATTLTGITIATVASFIVSVNYAPIVKLLLLLLQPPHLALLFMVITKTTNITLSL